MRRSRVQTLFAVITFAAGAIAAYMMYKRGASPLTIAKNALLNPVGSLASELKTASIQKNI